MPEGHDTTIEVCDIMSFVLYIQILRQSVLKPASPGITLIHFDQDKWVAVGQQAQVIALSVQ